MEDMLTNYAIVKLMRGEEVGQPIFQILGFKKIQGQGGNDRYRLNISDGIHSHTFAMLATQLNHMIPAGLLEAHSIIRADKIVANTVGEKRVLIILELTVIEKGCDVMSKIGDPKPWDAVNVKTESTANAAAPKPRSSSTANPMNGSTNGSAAPSRSTASKAPAPVGTSSFYPKTSPNFPQRSSGGGGGASTSEYTGPAVPISDLNPYTGRCAIRARVTSKSDIRTWSNAKGEGKLFNVELLDESGEIRLAGFNNSVDQFYEILEVGQVYVFKNFTVKTANRAFNSLSHDYEISMGNETQIYTCNEDISRIPKPTFSFIDIAQIEDLDKDSIIDVIGICKFAGELVNITTRNGKELKKREITLVDKSNREVVLTLWGKQAEDYNDDSQPVIAIKGARVGEYNGKNISAMGSSSIQINPDIPEAHSLRGWFDDEGKSVETRSLSSTKVAGGAAKWKILQEANIVEQIDSEKGDYFMCKVTVNSIKRDNFIYTACPQPNCQKKVLEMGNGQYRCEKCCNEFPSFKWRLMLQVNFADFSGHVWATCFQESAEVLLGQTAEQVGNIKDSTEAVDELFKNSLFKSYIVKFRAKLDSYNNETRKRTTVVELHELNYADYAKKLAAEIKESAF